MIRELTQRECDQVGGGMISVTPKSQERKQDGSPGSLSLGAAIFVGAVVGAWGAMVGGAVGGGVSGSAVAIGAATGAANGASTGKAPTALTLVRSML
ncbi:hypothetical protein [Methylobacterium oryzisoli]|uniref:hypothetical protein n=1 Tax=Methylobacterium oryzisoli TaxID=3385502 RepID=UPI00389126DC